MEEFNNQDGRMYPQNQRFNSDNPYMKYYRGQGERESFMDPARPNVDAANQRNPYMPNPMPQRPVFNPNAQQMQVPPMQPVYPQQMQVPPMPNPMQQPIQPMDGYGITQGQASRQDYEDQFDYPTSNRNPYHYQQPPKPQKKKGLFSSFLAKSSKPQQPEYQQPSFASKGVIMQIPTNIDDVKSIITMIKGGNTLIVDFSKVNANDAQRIIDYISGAIYALDGVQRPIGDKKFIFTPEGTGISGQLE